MWAALYALLCLCGPATAYEPAVRLAPPPPTITCESTEAMVNELPYEWSNMEPVRTAYRAVATHCMGWADDQVQRWESFIVDDVIKNESGGCWNLLRKGVVTTYLGCEVAYPNGWASDAGFFQLIKEYWYGPGQYLCVNFGVCDKQDIIGSPFNSMINGLRAIEHDGSRPWCYNDSARSFHRSCGTVPRNFG